MANIKSQIKRNKQNEKRHERNKAVKSGLKTAVRKFREAADAGDKDAAVEAGRAAPASSTRPPPRASSTRTRPPTASRRSPSAPPRSDARCARSTRRRTRSGGSFCRCHAAQLVAQAGDREDQPLQGVRRVAGRALDVGVGLGDRPDRPRDRRLGPGRVTGRGRCAPSTAAPRARGPGRRRAARAARRGSGRRPRALPANARGHQHRRGAGVERPAELLEGGRAAAPEGRVGHGERLRLGPAAEVLLDLGDPERLGRGSR